MVAKDAHFSVRGPQRLVVAGCKLTKAKRERLANVDSALACILAWGLSGLQPLFSFFSFFPKLFFTN